MLPVPKAVFSLSVLFKPEMPTTKSHPGFKMSLVRRHGDRHRPDGGSSANEIIIMGGHTGTHIDALGHISHCGCVYGGIRVEEIQQNERAVLSSHDISEVPPFVGQGVLIDLPRLLSLPAADERAAA